MSKTKFDELLSDYKDILDDEKELAQRKKLLREEIIQGCECLGAPAHPNIKSITIPKVLIEQGLDPKEIVEQSHPSWEISTITFDENGAQVQIQQTSNYLPYVYEGDGVIVRKSVVSSTPEINLDTLELECPGITEEITETTTTTKISDEKLSEKLTKDPTFMSVLERHLKVKPPTIKITVT
jgi:hypothetical protein